jgi:CheY-like chemotaxis protein
VRDRETRPPRQADTERAATEAVQRERKHLVVINGDPEFLKLMRDLLQDERPNVTATNFVPESFAMVASLQPGVIVLDVNVARRDGWDHRERLHTDPATAGIPVLVVSTTGAR